VRLELRDDSGEEVDGVRVAALLRGVPPLPRAAQVRVDPIREEPDMLEVADRVLRIIRELRGGGDRGSLPPDAD
jgi:hypothetical protein